MQKSHAKHHHGSCLSRSTAEVTKTQLRLNKHTKQAEELSGHHFSATSITRSKNEMPEAVGAIAHVKNEASQTSPGCPRDTCLLHISYPICGRVFFVLHTCSFLTIWPHWRLQQTTGSLTNHVSGAQAFNFVQSSFSAIFLCIFRSAMAITHSLRRASIFSKQKFSCKPLSQLQQARPNQGEARLQVR